MDPVTVGSAVAALIATQAAGGFATQAGTRAWDAVQSMVGSIRDRLSPSGSQALAQLEAGDAQQAVVELLGAEVHRLASSDPELSRVLQDLIGQAERNEPFAKVVAVARDDARQVNFGGDNRGTINMS